MQQKEMMSPTSWRRRGSAYNNRCFTVNIYVDCPANICPNILASPKRSQKVISGVSEKSGIKSFTIHIV